MKNRSAGFQTCCVADFQVGGRSDNRASAGWKPAIVTRRSALRSAGFQTCRIADFQSADVSGETNLVETWRFEIPSFSKCVFFSIRSKSSLGSDDFHTAQNIFSPPLLHLESSSTTPATSLSDHTNPPA